MKKIIIPLMTVAVVAALLLGCMPGAPPVVPPPVAPPPVTPPPVAPPVTPPPVAPPVAPRTAADVPELAGLCRPDLAMDYGEPFAFKPDGTPYRFATSYILLGCEEMINYEGVVCASVAKAGGEYSMFDANFDADSQVAYLEDLATISPPDILLLHAVNELALAPAVDKCTAAGILCYAFDPPCYSDNVISYVHHWFEGPIGSGLCGNKWVELAEAENKEYTVLEIWGDSAAMWSQGRHEGHYQAIKDHPLITLIESSDCLGSDEKTAEFVIDNLTARPEINGIYHQCGGQSGIIAGLRTLGKLKPIGDPEHITVNTFEGATPVMAEMMKGNIDWVSTHGPWDVCDTIVKVALWNAVCGVAMPKDIVPPMILLNAENLQESNYFGAQYWTQMPPERWDIWPILDTETPGSLVLLPEGIRGFYFGESTPWELRAPSIQDRKDNMGY